MKKLLSPLIGIFIGIFLVFAAISSSGPLGGFIDIPSIVITFFGSMSAVFISFPLSDFSKFPKIIKELMIDEDDNRVELVQSFIELSKKSRVHGILSIEEDIQTTNNKMLQNGLQMVIDGKDGESVREQLELEIDLTEDKYKSAPSILSKWGEYAPAFGMIGTLIGLIVMLGELNDPSTIGSGMATALVTTFYGTVLANLVFLPLASNLEQLAAEKIVTSEIVLEGVISIQEGQSPRDIEEKLKTFLTTKELSEIAAKETELFGKLENQEV